MERPESYRFTSSHEWVNADDKGFITLGITDYAVKALRDLVYVDLPDVEDIVEKGNTFGEIESVKAVSDLYSPVDGEVVEVNDVLTEDIDPLAKDPYGDGWLVKIKLDNPDQLETLMTLKEYEKGLK